METVDFGFRTCVGAAAMCLTAFSMPAAAKPLTSIWSLEPLAATGDMDVEFGKSFLEQRLLPYRLARLREDALLANGKSLAAGTHLFIVYQADGRAAFCTIKDQSLGNVSKSLFIPALDTRPCLVDADNDGRFEASFGVFDKYGSALTPSGNLSSAKPLKGPAAFDVVDPKTFPVTRKFSYALDGSQSPEKTKIAVKFDNGGGYVAWENSAIRPKPNEPHALNLKAEIRSISNGVASISVSVDPTLFVVGGSSGGFWAASLPDFAK